MLCEPPARDEMLQVAVLMPVNGPVGVTDWLVHGVKAVTPSAKLTVPEGASGPGTPVTVAVKVSAVP